MFGANKKRRRRSELRLGASAANLSTVSTPRPSISFTPVVQFWQNRGAKVVGIFLLVVLGWSGYSLFTESSFFVYDAEITGNAALSDREIYLVSQVDEQSIFWINPDQVEARVTALPNVKSARVTLSLPNQLAITVIERQPEILWQTGEKIWWIDREGTVVPPRAEVEDMLKIIDDDIQPLEAGYQINASIIKGAQALRLLAPNVSIIRHTRAQGLIVSTPEGWPVYLGDGSEMRGKLLVLSGLLDDLREEERPPLYIDLRNPLQPVYKIKPEEKPPPVLLRRQPILPAPGRPVQPGPQQGWPPLR
jgi:cell division septal protein FtsQ